MIFAAIVQRRTVRAERACHKHAPTRKLCIRRSRELHRLQQSRIYTLRRQTHLRVAHARHLVAARGNALRPGRDESAMHGNQLLRLIFKNMRRPQRPVDPRA